MHFKVYVWQSYAVSPKQFNVGLNRILNHNIKILVNKNIQENNPLCKDYLFYSVLFWQITIKILFWSMKIMEIMRKTTILKLRIVVIWRFGEKNSDTAEACWLFCIKSNNFVKSNGYCYYFLCEIAWLQIVSLVQHSWLQRDNELKDLHSYCSHKR